MYITTTERERGLRSSPHPEFDEKIAPSNIIAGVCTSGEGCISIKYEFIGNAWSASYCATIDDECDSEETIEPEDAYAYIMSIEPEVIEELTKLTEFEDIPMRMLQGGDKTNVETVLEPEIEISNFMVTKGACSNGNGCNYKIEFDVTNITSVEQKVDNTDIGLCYLSDDGNDCRSLYLDVNTTLEPGETISIEKVIFDLENITDFSAHCI